MNIDEAIKNFRYDAENNRADLDLEFAKENEQIAKWLTKLKEYEDLEEQDRLLKLPCKEVYYIVDKNNPKYAAVMSKSIRDLTVYEIENIDIDGRYFSTEESAEAKLKELRGGKNGSME
jgi:hypothetical protein